MNKEVEIVYLDAVLGEITDGEFVDLLERLGIDLEDETTYSVDEDLGSVILTSPSDIQVFEEFMKEVKVRKIKNIGKRVLMIGVPVLALTGLTYLALKNSHSVEYTDYVDVPVVDSE